MKLIVSFGLMMIMASVTFGHCGVCGHGHEHSGSDDSVSTTSCCSVNPDKGDSCCKKKKAKKEIKHEMKLVRKADKLLVFSAETQKKVDKITVSYEKKVAKLNKSYCKSIKKELTSAEFASFKAVHKQCN